MKPYFFLIFLLSAVFITLSCKEEITTPEEKLKNPTEMVWKIDTLYYPDSYQVLMKSIWGSSPDNVWTCGFHDRSKASAWHYNGNEWSYYELSKDIDRSALSLEKVYGFNQSNVWMTGERLLSYNSNTDSWASKPLIINFNGSKWIEHEVKANNIFINDVWGTEANNVFCSGFGEILNYNGSVWKKEIIGDSTLIISGVRETKVGKYMLAIKPQTASTPHTTYFYKYELNKWKIIDSTLYSRNFGQKLYLSNSGKLYSYGWEGIFLYDGGQWLKQYQYLAAEDMIAANDKYILAVGQGGQAFFSDGTAWIKIKDINIPTAVYTSVWSNGTEVFIVGNLVNSVPMKTIVWHGK
ncbi:MAG: hypothetical protein WCZ90_01050 [Melioribacteraceae bacterium]